MLCLFTVEYDDNDNVLPLGAPILQVTKEHLSETMTLANVKFGSYNHDYKRPPLSSDCKFICGMVQSEICGVVKAPESFEKPVKWIIPHANDVSAIYGCEVWYSATGIYFYYIHFFFCPVSPKRRIFLGISKS